MMHSFLVAEVQSGRGLPPTSQGQQDYCSWWPGLRGVYSVCSSEHAGQASLVQPFNCTPCFSQIGSQSELAAL